MESRYILIISNKKLYKEIEISKESKSVSIGTTNGCSARLRKDDFFEPVTLLMGMTNKGWQIACADNLYISDGGAAKLLAKKLEHGSEFEVRYQSSGQLVFKALFQIDFAGDSRDYDREVDITSCNTLTIGNSKNNDIVINSPYTQGASVVLSKSHEGLMLQKDQTPYGFYLNGRKADEGETVHDTDFFSISDCFFYFREGKIWTESSERIRIPNLPFSEHRIPADYPKFTRNTRIKTVINDEKIEILDPPSKPQKPKNNLVIKLLPSLGMLVASGAMAYFGGMMIALSAVSAVMAVITTVATIRESNKDYKHDSEARVTKYNAYAERKREEIKAARDAERNELEEIYISTDEELLRLHSFSPNLFDRQKDDEDFLCVRLGEGKIDAKRAINYKKQERFEVEDELQNIPGEINEEYKYVDHAPVICDFKKDHAVGICGDEPFRFEFLKKIIVDLVSRHYQSDVRIAFVTEEEHIDWVNWLRFLPHVTNPVSGVRDIACDEESKNQLFEYLYNELTSREDKKGYSYNIVVFFVDECGFKHHPISRFVEKASELGVTFVFFEDTQEKLPQGCVHVIAPKADNTGILIDSSDKNKSIEFSYSTVSDEQMEEIVRILAPVYTEELSLEGNLTRSLSLFELLGILSAEDIDLEERWAGSQSFKTMKAPIGVSNTGLVELDLHDKAHGPHGLVAGTTGSGKSELLLTYMLSMATLYHPHEVGFVIIDFKGGGMANQLRDLPHLIGTITNIDGKEIDRSLKSIKAELQKRQRLFAEADVNHIDKYIRKYRNQEVAVPLPHLIIVVDEFAELKAEQPEFMKELISAARIGRSLGVHLILATQKPAGQVDEQIWSNSRFKMCLKVQGPEDSNEVLKSPLAAEIKEPGRAYLQVGNNEIFELFQSGYSGAPEREGDSDIKEFKIYEIQENGQKSIAYQQKKQASENSKTQLDAVVSHIAAYSEKKHLTKLQPICLPPLPEVIAFPKEVSKPEKAGILADVGIYDDPDNQIQKQYTINVTNENVMIIGSSQTGKTNLLQTIIRDISSKYTPEEVNFYIIDFASMFLKNYEKLAHVGGVVTPSEDEKLKSLFRLLQTEMERRRETLLKVGVSSYSAYLEAGFKDIPQIILIVDNITALKELYFEDDDELIGICRDGLTLGISVILANSVTTGIGFRYISNFSCRMALFNNDSTEYGSIFDHCRETLYDIPGRSLIEIDKNHYECQVYLAAEGEKEIDRLTDINAWIEKCNATNGELHAKMIPEIPDILTESYLAENFRIMLEHFEIPLGLNYQTVQPETLKMSRLPAPLVISGREGMGMEEFIRYLVFSLDKIWDGETRVYIIDNMLRRLEILQKLDNVVSYSRLHSKAIDAVKTVYEIVASRYEALSAGRDLDIDKEPLIVLLINNRDALEMISNDMDAKEAYQSIIERFKNMNVCVILGDYENTQIGYSAPEIIRMARDAGHFVFFDDLKQMKVVDVPLSTIRENKKRILHGDSYYLKSGECIKVKLPIS